MKALNRLFAPLFGLAVSIILVFVFAKNPSTAMKTFFVTGFTSTYYLGAMLNTAAFLMLSGTGAALAIKSGSMNLGGEGQIYAGGFVGCLVLNSVPGPTVIVFLLALTASMATGCLIALVSALLQEKRGAEVLLTSFLLSAACIPLIDGLITASKSNVSTNMLALPYIQDRFRMPSILSPSPLSWSIFLAVAVCAAAWFYLEKTKSGSRLKITGTAPLFAKYCGFNSTRYSCLSLSASGALHALTGFMAVCGTYFTCHKDFYLGMGWNALSTALVASSNPLAIIPSSLLLAWLYTSADRVALTQSFGFDMAGIIQGVVLFSIAVTSLAGRRLVKRRNSK